MNNFISDMFTFLVTILHYIFFIGLTLFVVFLDSVPIELRVAYAAVAFVSYVIFFGIVSTFVTIKDQLIELNQTMKQINLPK